MAFATLLFVIYFCAVCCFFYSPKNSIPATTESVPLEPTENEEFIEDLWESEQTITVNHEPQPEPTPESPNQEPTLEELLQGIDIDTLQLRPARKICSRLGIQQKVNGKDAPLSWL